MRDAGRRLRPHPDIHSARFHDPFTAQSTSNYDAYGTTYPSPAPTAPAGILNKQGAYAPVGPRPPGTGLAFLQHEPVAFPTPRALRENDFMRRQTMRRGKTRKTKLTEKGHWIQEYKVPLATQEKFEPRWRAMAGKSEEGKDEFS